MLVVEITATKKIQTAVVFLKILYNDNTSITGFRCVIYFVLDIYCYKNNFYLSQSSCACIFCGGRI